MNFKQDNSGRITADFLPSELPSLVRMVRIAEDWRQEEMAKVATKHLLAIQAAEEGLPPTKEHNETTV